MLEQHVKLYVKMFEIAHPAPRCMQMTTDVRMDKNN